MIIDDWYVRSTFGFLLVQAAAGIAYALKKDRQVDRMQQKLDDLDKAHIEQRVHEASNTAKLDKLIEGQIRQEEQLKALKNSFEESKLK